MDKYRKRRLWFCVIVTAICLLPVIFYPTLSFLTLALIAASLPIWGMVFIIGIDRKNKYWVTRYFNP